MIKKQNKIISIFAIALSLVLVPNVKAAMMHYIPADYKTGITLIDDQGGSHEYNDPRFTVDLDGKTYEGYCVDPGYSMSSSVAATCEPLTSKPAMSWLMQNLTGDHIVDQLAVRMVAIREDINKQISLKGTGIVKYLEERLWGPGTSNRLYGSDKVEKAYDLHLEAMANAGNVSTEATTLTFAKSGGSGATVTYKITSNTPIDSSSIDFTCNGCTINSKTWNGTSGTITVTAIPNNCSFTINAYYPSAGTYICSTTSGVTFQNIVINVITNGTVSTTGEPTQKFTGKIDYTTGGDYYKTYCENQNTDENSCDQKTEVNIPEYCDDANNEEITITAPTDVKNCILNSSDEAGNTYQSTAVSSYNPYCSVFCKEDYKMTLPGAQYTTSGKYFDLKNVVASGTRSCYVTGSQTGNGTEGIDLVQYKKDMVSYQKDLVAAFNAYKKAKVIYDNMDAYKKVNIDTNGDGKADLDIDTNGDGEPDLNIDSNGDKIPDVNVDTNGDGKADLNINPNFKKTYKVTKTETQSCDGSKKETKYTLSSQAYTTYTANCNESTGRCTLTATTSYTGEVTWGKSKNTKSDSDTRYSKTPLEGYNCGNAPNPLTGYYTCVETTCSDEADTDHGSAPTEPSKIEITKATNKLKEAIANISSCYNWTNDYCFEPELEFDYNEQYNTDINFDKVAGSETQSSSISIGTSIDNQYNTNNSGSITEDIEYIGCDENGCYANGNIATNISSTVTYIKKVVSKSAQYNNKQAFQTNYPHGTIDTVSNPSNIRYNYSYLGAIFPVALKTPTGVYNWTLNFKNVGQYNNSSSCNLGRLNQVATAIGTTLSNDIGYVCVYVVDCDDCDYSCECPTNLPDGYSCVKKSKFVCEIEPSDQEPKCDDCEVYCVNCIFDGKDTYGYRTISLTDINPNNRTMGANWTSEKGKTTKEEIERNNEQIYREPDYSYTITATQMKNIRDYNNATGTYVAEDLTYHKQEGYNNIYGTSEFLDTGGNKYFTENKRNKKWTLWTGTINTEGSGPSWK